MPENGLFIVNKEVNKLVDQASKVSEKVQHLMMNSDFGAANNGVDPFVFAITIFVLACFVGYYVVWKVTPALHTPLMSVTNAISGIIVIGAMAAAASNDSITAQLFGFIAVVLASINIFGGFVVTQRMLSMFKKKHK
jgi:NAD(P) transhydrogenase subunit alpha